MDGKLFAQALLKFAAGVVVMGLLLFLPAGTFAWWQGWLLMGILFVPMFVAGFVMMAKAPDLLRKRNSNIDGSNRFALALICAGEGYPVSEERRYRSDRPSPEKEG